MAPPVRPSRRSLLLLTIISSSYMSPWTCVGSLIPHYTSLYGPRYFTLLNAAFYTAGYPTARMQTAMDEGYDRMLGPKKAFLVRMLTCTAFLAFYSFLAESVTLKDPNAMMLLTFLAGVATWGSHGALTSTASMFQVEAVSYLQVGFMLPNVYCLALNRIYQTEYEGFFVVTGLIVLVGAACSACLAMTREARDAQDGYMKDLDLRRELLSDDYGNGDGAVNGADAPDGDNRGAGMGGDGGEVNDENLLEGGSGARHPRPSKGAHDEEVGDGLLTSCDDVETTASSSSSSSSPSSPSKRNLSSIVTLRNSGRGVGAPNPRSSYIEAVSMHRAVLFMTIFLSVFCGSFFSYVKPEVDAGGGGGGEGAGYEITQVLYFSRLFSDLFGRFLTLLPRPKFLQDIRGLCYLLVPRVITTCLYFMYVSDLFPYPLSRSDVVVSVLVVLNGCHSGYSAVLSYQMAQEDVGFRGGREEGKILASKGMNESFHAACGIAAIANLVVVFGGKGG